PLFDVHRIRHIIEPNAQLFLTGSTVQSEGLPVYDPDVEAINDGPGARIGLRNTFQTQRGTAGQWRSVDWLGVNTDLIFMPLDHTLLRDSLYNRERALAGLPRQPGIDSVNPIPRFIDFRPEDSIGGNHFYSNAMWMLSDTLAAVGEITESLDNGTVD